MHAHTLLLPHCNAQAETARVAWLLDTLARSPITSTAANSTGGGGGGGSVNVLVVGGMGCGKSLAVAQHLLRHRQMEGRGGSSIMVSACQRFPFALLQHLF
jgi:hypothetical protein